MSHYTESFVNLTYGNSANSGILCTNTTVWPDKWAQCSHREMMVSVLVSITSFVLVSLVRNADSNQIETLTTVDGRNKSAAEQSHLILLLMLQQSTTSKLNLQRPLKVKECRVLWMYYSTLSTLLNALYNFNKLCSTAYLPKKTISMAKMWKYPSLNIHNYSSVPVCPACVLHPSACWNLSLVFLSNF